MMYLRYGFSIDEAIKVLKNIETSKQQQLMNRLKQGIAFISLFLFFINCSQKQSVEWIPFIWEGDTISGKYIEKAFIYIPVKIDDLPHDFTMQLDLGANKTVFYGNTIYPYLKEYTSLTDNYNTPMLNNVRIQMGTVEFKSIDVGYMSGFGEKIHKDSLHTKTLKHIGTIAPDIFRDKILVIDYKSNRLAVSGSLPDEYRDLPAEEFELKDGIIKLPFRINEKDCKLMFDTGSSSFQLVTSRERALEISDSVIIDSLSGPLWWGKEITFYGLNVNKTIKFKGYVLENSKVYYDKDGLWNEIFDSFDIWGITGNAYFFDNIVIIDYRNKIFRME